MSSMMEKGGWCDALEALEPRRLLALVVDPVATAPLDEGDVVTYVFTIQESLPARHRFHIDWGDAAEYISGDFDSSITSFATPAHQFRDNGPAPSHAFDATITVWSIDVDGGVIEEASRAFEQVVHNLPPSIATPLAPRTTIEGQGLTFEYLQIDRGLDDVISVAVDWGDGDISVSPSVRVNRPEFGFDAFPVKPLPYARAGTYLLTVSSTDDDGGTLIEQSQVIVQRRFSLAGSSSVLADQQYTLELRTTNPDAQAVTWLIDWGDGAAPQEFIAQMSASSPAFATHTFAGPVSFQAHIVASAEEDSITYPNTSKFIDVLGTLPAPPTLFGVEVTSNTTLDLPYAALRQAKVIWNSIVPQRIDTFDIERSATGIDGWQVIAPNLTPDISGTTSYTDLSATQTTFYRVRAKYNGNYSDYAPVMAARFDADYGLELGAVVQENAPEIRLTWRPADPAVTAFRVYRKLASASSWQLLTELPVTQNEYVDSNVLVDVPYEYRVDRLNAPGATASPGDVDRSFIMSGINLPLPADDAQRGAILVIDQTAYADPAVVDAIGQYQRDLIGERYEVAMIFVQPSDDPRAAHAIRDQIESRTILMHTTPAAIVLIGHVPAPYSGHGAHDFHADHGGAWSTDIFYGDLIAERSKPWWTDEDLVKPNRPANYNEPEDGKFDNDVVPDRIEVPVGRIDFFEPGRERFLEFAEIVKYLAKDHRYRTGQTSFVRDAVIDVRLTRGHSIRAGPEYATFAGLVGQDEVATRNWRVALTEPQIHQFAAAIGAGSWDRIFDPNNAETIEGNLVTPFDPYWIKALFAQTTGSLFGDFYAYEQDVNSQNMLRYLLRAGEVLTNVYVEAAPFEMHTFGMGESIGLSLLRNWNSRGEYDRSDSSIHGSITLSLMGDPTLTMNIVQPVMNVTATEKSGHVTINWSGIAAKYRVYRATALDGEFELIAETANPTFTDTAPGANHLYMVRAVQLIESRSGTYFAASTGVIVDSASRVPPGNKPPSPQTPRKPLSIRNALEDLDEWLNAVSIDRAPQSEPR